MLQITNPAGHPDTIPFFPANHRDTTRLHRLEMLQCLQKVTASETNSDLGVKTTPTTLQGGPTKKLHPRKLRSSLKKEPCEEEISSSNHQF